MHDSYSSFFRSKIVAAGILSILSLGLVTGVYVVTQRFGAFELRQRASETHGSQFVLTGPAAVEPGKSFDVQVYIDTTTDPDYAPTTTEALIAYDPGASIPAPIFASAPPHTSSAPQPTSSSGRPPFPLRSPIPPLPSSGQPLPSASPGECPYPNRRRLCPMMPLYACPDGQVSVTIDTDPCVCPRQECQPGVPLQVQGVTTAAVGLTLLGTSYGPAFSTNATSQMGVGLVQIKGEAPHDIQNHRKALFATLTFQAASEGTAEVKVVFLGQNVTNDSNIYSYLRSQPAQIQHKQDRLLSQPAPLTITIVTYSSSPGPFGTRPPFPRPSPSGSCIPRPPCLDIPNPRLRCKLPERSDYCPPTGCYYQPVECIQAPCNPILICPSSPPSSGQTPSPTPSATTTTDSSSNGFGSFVNPNRTYQQTTQEIEDNSSMSEPGSYYDSLFGFQTPAQTSFGTIPSSLSQQPTTQAVPVQTPEQASALLAIIAHMRSLWGSNNTAYDLNQDGIINGRDLFLLFQTMAGQ